MSMGPRAKSTACTSGVPQLMDGDGSVEGEQDGGVQSIRKQRLTTASGKQKVNESRKVVDVDGPKGEVDRVYFRAPDELTIAYSPVTLSL
jgi:hypothetical protein